MTQVPLRLLGATLLTLLAVVPAVAQAPARVVLRAENTLDEARPDQVIALPWSALAQRLPALTPARVRAVDAGTGQELLSQVLDADGDSRPDSLLILAGFWPRQVREIAVEAEPAVQPPAARVHVFWDERRDDMAWETDRIGYRIYGLGLLKLEPTTKSSGVDIFVKRTPAMVLEKWYAADLKQGGVYHHDLGEGADMYGVGLSLGAGGTGIYRDGKLYRPINFHTHRILAEGPVRLVFEVAYDAFDAGGTMVSETRRISMDAGQNLFREESVYRFDGPAMLTYAVGTVLRPELVGGTTRIVGKRAWMSTWGPIDVKYSGGHGDLGTGVVMDSAALLETREAAGHYLALASVRPGVPVIVYAGAGWDDDGHLSGPKDWWAYLTDFSRRLDAPIRVTFP